ncbi:MAG: DUF6544 family protein [Actinomycetales bacterium]
MTSAPRGAVAEHLDRQTRFDPSAVHGLPEPARRWLVHSVAGDTPMYTRVDLELEGHLKLGSWRRFTARQTIRPHYGYSWSATTHVATLPVSGVESMSPATARKIWQAAGLFPVVRVQGPELLNSAAGRLAAESFFVPTAFSLASWETTADLESAFATWRLGARVDRVRIDVAPSGRLRSVALRRWGSPPGARYARHPFSLRFEEELDVGGVLIPRTFTAHWGAERPDDGAFMRAQVVAAHFS